jgi:hypothetical protein
MIEDKKTSNYIKKNQNAIEGKDNKGWHIFL